MSPRDDLHHQARALSKQYGRIITSQEVLSEFMNFFCGRGDQLRQTAVQLVRTLQNNKNITVFEQTSKSFSQGMDLYAKRVDKEYSFTVQRKLIIYNSLQYLATKESKT